MNDPVIRAIVEPFWHRFKSPEFGSSIESESHVEFTAMYKYKGKPYSAAPGSPVSRGMWTPIHRFYMRIFIYRNELTIRSREEDAAISKSWHFNLSDPASIDNIRKKVEELLDNNTKKEVEDESGCKREE